MVSSVGAVCAGADLMTLVLSSLLLALALGGALAIAQRLRPGPLALALPLALAVLVAFEGVVLPAISERRWITPVGLVLAHLPLVAAGVVGLWRTGPGLVTGAGRLARRAAWTLRPRAAFVALLPMLPLLAVSAFAYPPNTWDSMTYHLSRVAHWAANGSVLPYHTWIPRQILFPPGAEYVLLVPQVLAGSDRLAAGLQLVCWMLAVVAAPALARLFGAPRRLAPFAALLVAALPMGVLQATSTQNDLVAAVVAVAAVIAALRVAQSHRPRWEDGAALGIALGAAWLVKATALIAAAPFVAWAVLAGVARGRDGVARALRLGAGALVPALVIVGAEAMRRFPLGFPDVAPTYHYPLTGEWLDRALHAVRAVGHHLPIPRLLTATAPGLASDVGRGLGAGPEPFRPSEDHAGNPLQAALFLVAVGVAIVRWRRLPPRARVGLLAPAAGWLLLHALGRENAWFSRLETPLFVLGVAALGVTAGLTPRWRARASRLAAVAAVPLLGWALVVAWRNEMRPVADAPGDPVASYYVRRPAVRDLDDATLAVARAAHCARVGVRFGPEDRYWDPWEYPLVWRGHEAGIEVRDADGSEDWPCVVLSVADAPAGRWVLVRGTRVFVRAQ